MVRARLSVLKSFRWKSLMFPVACVVVFALGVVLRLQPWRVMPEVAQARALPGSIQVKLPAGLGEVVFNFYERLDRGQYGEAYDMSLENQWAPQADGAYMAMGLTPRQEFVDALTAEMGANGELIAVPATQVLAVNPITPGQKPLAEQPEQAVLNHLPAGLRLKTLYEVDVTGMVGDVCTPARFDKRLIVADFGDGQWKVLLPGGPRPDSKRKTEWFTNGNPFAGKQLTDERKPQ